MTDWLPIDQLWHGALAIVPVAAAAAVLGRLAPFRPSTRHAMWLSVLAVLVAVPLAPRPPLQPLDLTPKPQPPRGAAPAPERDLPAGALAPSPRPLRAAAPTFRPPGAPAPPASSPENATPSSPQLATDMPAPATPPLSPRIGVTPSNRPVLTPRGATLDTGGAPAGGLEKGSLPLAAVAAFLEQWRAGLLSLRDALLALPPVPAPVWGAGLLIGAALAACRLHGVRRLLAEASPAPPELRRRVARAGAQLGLRRPPVTLITDRAIPPMLWCGRRLRLVLPRALWAQLDDPGRDAVLYHELAHLRRRDHWVCRAEMLIGWIWWWHPVVWWIRRRVREDADLCCDAWVLALMPSGRRAYAQALLETRRMSNSLAAGPAVGLGASTLRARRFARRLTMVMTAQYRPRLSLVGAALVCTLAICGYLSSPLWACPPESEGSEGSGAAAGKKGQTYATTVPAAPRAPMAPRAPRSPVATSCPRAPTLAPAPGETTYEQFIRGRAPDGSDREPLELRIEQLERQIQELHELLEQLLRSDRPGGVSSITPAPQPDGAPLMIRVGQGLAVAVPQGIGTWPVGCLSGAALAGGPIVARSYEVPEGKLELLGALLAREDVPVRVAIRDGTIELHATEGQQCVFETFLSLINGEERATPYALPEGKLEALTELMVRSDVPIFVSPGEESITLHGNDVEQAVFLAFLTLINPSQDQAGAAALAAAEATPDAVARVEQYEAEAAAAVAQMRGLRSALQSHQRQREAIERQIERSRERVDQYREKADEAENKAQEYEDRAAELDADGSKRAKHEEALAKARDWRSKAVAARDTAESLEVQAQQLEEQLAAMEEAAAELEQQLEDLESEASND